MAGPDLTGTRRAVENLLDDTGRVERDADGRSDGVLDEETGLVGQVGAGGTVYDGPMLVSPVASIADDGTVRLTGLSPEQESPGRYRALLPLSAPEVRAGDRLVVTSSRRDAQLAGRAFRIVDPGGVGTYVVVRVLTMTEDDA